MNNTYLVLNKGKHIVVEAETKNQHIDLNMIFGNGMVEEGGIVVDLEALKLHEKNEREGN